MGELSVNMRNTKTRLIVDIYICCLTYVFLLYKELVLKKLNSARKDFLTSY